MSAFDVDAVIKKILDLRVKRPEVPAGITADEIRQILAQVTEVFKKEPTLLELPAPITVCGDIRGQIHELIRIFDKTGYPPETRYLFLGDYVNNGPRSVETICLLFCYKIKYPDRVFMLRGYCECKYAMRLKGCYDEIVANYDADEPQGLFTALSNTCHWLPFAAIVGEKVFCVHGGIDPELESLDDIREIKRPLEIPDEGLVCGLLWNCPDPSVDDWDVIESSENGYGKLFGKAPVASFLESNDFDLIIRGHQVVPNGYEFPFESDQTVLTVFSASNYEYLDNYGVVVNIDENLHCSFETFEPIDYPREE